MNYTITYDLVKSRDYQKIIDEIERMGGCRIVESVYFITLKGWTTQRVKDHFERFVDQDDLLVIIPIGGRPRFTLAYTVGSDWITRVFGRFL